MENLVNPAFWADKRVFLTGHTGFKGAWLALWLTDMGAQVHGYALAPEQPGSLFEQLALGERIARSTLADIRDNPVTLAQAAPQIEQFLFNKKNKDAADAELKRLRAAAKIEYLGKDAAPAAAAP